jgi:hypothetical protein
MKEGSHVNKWLGNASMMAFRMLGQSGFEKKAGRSGISLL